MGFRDQTPQRLRTSGGYPSGDEPVGEVKAPEGPAPGAQSKPLAAVVLIEGCCDHFYGVKFIGTREECGAWINSQPEPEDGMAFEIEAP